MQVFNVMLHPADVGGCAHYRLNFPSWAMRTIFRDVRVIDSLKMFPIPQFYQDIRLLRIQRQVSAEQCKFFLDFLKPVSEKTGTWLNYEIDDCIHKDDIPPYNIGREAYLAPGLMDNIEKMLNASDFVTVTCQNLSNYYRDKFNVPEENIVVLPNYLPRWWIGEVYDERRIINRYQEQVVKNKKPRIGFVSSSTHFDIKNLNGGFDDFTHINDFIRNTKDKYQWVFVGGHPQQLMDLIQDGSVEFHQGSDILNYPREMDMKKLDLVVAPLVDNTFNKCKSNIKFLEMSALGIPVICQDLDPYHGYTDLLFNDTNDLQNKIDQVLKSEDDYMNIVKNYRNIIDFGDSKSKNGWWLEKNLDKFVPIYKLTQKTFKYDLSVKEEIENKSYESMEVEFNINE
jgi:hypothetical protein